MGLQENEIAKVIEMYESGMSLAATGKAFGISGQAVNGLLTRRGIKKRTLSQAARTLECNHSFFDQPMDEIRAYWIGFILADGSVSEQAYGRTKALSIVLKHGDRGHLEKFKKALGAQHKIIPVSHKTGHKGARLAISSSEMVDALAEYNIEPRKSADQKFSENIPPDLLRHYFRGYFDGNGGIARHHSSKWIIYNTSSKGFLERFVKWTVDEVGGHSAEVSFSDGIHRVSWTGTHRCKEILDLMYHGANVSLDRKASLYERVCYDAKHSGRGPYNRRV